MRADLSDPVCSKSPVNIYSRVSGIFTSPSGKSTNSSSSSSSKSASSSGGGCKNSPVCSKQQSLFRPSTDSICDSKSQLFYLENYANQHLEGEGLKGQQQALQGNAPSPVDGGRLLLLTGDEYVSGKEHQHQHDSESEVSSSGEAEDNEFEMAMGEEGELSEPEIKVEDD